MAKKSKKPKSRESLVDAALQAADNYLMDLCEPGKMDPEQAVAFLDAVIARCESAVEALKEENNMDTDPENF